MKNINKLRLAIVLSLYLIAFTVDTIKGAEILPSITAQIEDFKVTLSRESFKTVKIYDLKTGQLVKKVTDTNIIYLDGFEHGQYIIKAGQNKAITVKI